MFYIYDKYSNNPNLNIKTVADYRGSTQYKENKKQIQGKENKKQGQYKGSLNRHYNEFYPEKKYKSISTDTAKLYLKQINSIMQSLKQNYINSKHKNSYT